MTPAGFATYSAALAIAAVIPGPQIVALVAHAMSSGYRRAFWMTAGMVIGDVLYLSAVLAGLAYIAESFSILLIAIKWAGVAYLSWLAVQFWRAGNVAYEGGLPNRVNRRFNALISGVLVTLGNPKSVLFYVALLPTIIDLDAIGTSDVVILLALTSVILSLAQLPFVILAANARNVLRSPRALKIFNRAAAVTMGGAAATIATRT